MSPTVVISSSSEFSRILSTSTIVVVDFYADWCGPCKAISPVFESLSTKYSKPNRITFTKVNCDSQKEISAKYGVRAMPTFMIFRSGVILETVKGASQGALMNAVEKAVKLAGPAQPTFSSKGHTLGGSSTTPRASLSRPFNYQSYIDVILRFFGLYFLSLFSLDAYKAAEESPFNINRDGRSGGSTIGTSRGGANSGEKRSGAATQIGKKLGTIADLRSD